MKNLQDSKPLKKRRRPFASSWDLLKESFHFLEKNKDLLILPLCSLIATLAIFGLMLAAGVMDVLKIEAIHMAIISGAIIFFVGYFILTFIVLLFNAALIACVSARLQGQSASVSDGLQIALKHLKSILIWCMISFVVGQIISFLERSHRLIAEIIAGVIGFAWGLATYFVMPMLILEDMSPMAAMKQSAKVFGKKWRRVVSATFLLALMFIAITGLWIYALIHLPTQSALLLEIGLPILIMLLITLSIVGSAIAAIVRCALYLKLARNIEPQNFDSALLDKTLIPVSSSRSLFGLFRR